MKRKTSAVAFAHLAVLALIAAPAAGGPARLEPRAATGRHLEPSAAPWLAPWSPTSSPASPFVDLSRPIAQPMRAGADPLDVHWQSRFGLPVPNAGIRTLLPHDGLLVAGGWFTRIGRLEAPGLAAWNGIKWSLLGDFPGTAVHELAPYPGGLVAMGTAGSGLDVWRWTGSSWQSLGFPPGLNEGLDMTVSNETIAVSASVYVADEWRSQVYLYTGLGWTALGDVFDGPMPSLAWYGGALHAGGGPSHGPGADSTTAVVSRWNGESWEGIDGGLAKGSWARVSALAVFDGELVAGGYGLDVTDPFAPASVVRWNGSTWAALGSGGPEYPNIERMRVIGDDLYALGSFYSGYGIARWDGVSWHLAEDALQVRVFDLASFAGRLYAGGALSINGSSPAPPLSVRGEDQWGPVSHPRAGMQGFLGWSGPMVTGLAALDGAIFAAGRFDFAGATDGWRRCAGGARWDGLDWSPLGFESFRYAYPQDVTIHEGAVHALGSFSTSDGQSGTVARLDAGEWRMVGGPSSASFYNVHRIASARGDLFVGGLVDPQYFSGIARWDGSTWSTLGGGVTKGNWVSAIVSHGADVIVAGSFEEVGGVACRNIAAWNPATGWRPLGPGLDGNVNDLLSRDGVLYAAGGFRLAGSAEASAIAQWRGGVWEALPSPLSSGWYGGVWSLAWYRGRLVASGYEIPGMLASLEADGTWRALGSGLDQPAVRMVESGPSLFVGGYFSRAGAVDAYGFAEWREGGVFEPAIQPRVTAAPNPFASTLHLRYELAAGGRVRLEIFDIAGHQVERVFDGFQGAGPQDIAWRPGASRVRPGVYFARLTAGGSSRIVRVVRVE